MNTAITAAAATSLAYVPDVEAMGVGEVSWKRPGEVLAARLRLVSLRDGMALRLYGLLATGEVERYLWKWTLHRSNKDGKVLVMPEAMGELRIGCRVGRDALALLPPAGPVVALCIEDEAEWVASRPDALRLALDGPHGMQRSWKEIGVAMKALPALPGAL